MFLYPLSRMTGGIYYEHAHRLIGSLVGLTTLVLAIHLQRVERRAWLRRLALAALGVVIVQGVLGGLRVTGRFTFSASPQDTAPNITLAIVHGVLGQVFFAMLVATAVFCLATWRSDRPAAAQPWAATDRAFGVLLVVLLIVQLVLGAVLRHISGGLHIHITMAVVVVFLAINCGVRAWGLNETEPILQRTGQALIVLAAGQVVLGLCALAAVGASADAPAPTGVDVLVTGAHQAVGALLLACAVSLALWNFRLLAPPSAIGGAEIAS
jgi:cytochrome c oxidase assembly protein subunit 15